MFDGFIYKKKKKHLKNWNQHSRHNYSSYLLKIQTGYEFVTAIDFAMYTKYHHSIIDAQIQMLFVFCFACMAFSEAVP